MTKEKLEKLVATWDPSFGFHVKNVVLGDTHMIYLHFTPLTKSSLNLLEEPQLVWSCDAMTAATYGEKQRLLHVLEAVCRYVNVGGDWTKLSRFLEVMPLRDVWLDSPDYSLIATWFDTDATAQHFDAGFDKFTHLFMPADGLSGAYGVQWVEGQFFDVVSFDSFLHPKGLGIYDQPGPRFDGNSVGLLDSPSAQAPSRDAGEAG